jgi:hypothetical protein
MLRGSASQRGSSTIAMQASRGGTRLPARQTKQSALEAPLPRERKEPPPLFAKYARGPAPNLEKPSSVMSSVLSGTFATAISAAGRYNLVLCPASIYRELSPLSSHRWKLGTVQHESTATDLDRSGLVRTFWDGDLHRWTAVDVLPLYGMQEVWGSNPHSSTSAQRP